MVYENHQSPGLPVKKLAVGQDQSHVFTAILVAARRRSAESVDDHDIYAAP
jgi:hypothetical protein